MPHPCEAGFWGLVKGTEGTTLMGSEEGGQGAVASRWRPVMRLLSYYITTVRMNLE